MIYRLLRNCRTIDRFWRWVCCGLHRIWDLHWDVMLTDMLDVHLALLPVLPVLHHLVDGLTSVPLPGPALLAGNINIRHVALLVHQGLALRHDLLSVFGHVDRLTLDLVDLLALLPSPHLVPRCGALTVQGLEVVLPGQTPPRSLPRLLLQVLGPALAGHLALRLSQQDGQGLQQVIVTQAFPPQPGGGVSRGGGEQQQQQREQ